MPLSILYIAYPLLTVSPASAGGAEQMLLTVEREMANFGHHTTVAAADGSCVSGHLLPTGAPATARDDFDRRQLQHHTTILDYLRRHPDEFDLIHDESGAFFRLAAQCPVPVLATLHLPRDFYPSGIFQSLSSNAYFNCVSQSQANSFHDLPGLVSTIQNGISIDRFPFTPEKDNYLFWLGRICEEKAPHLAIAAARQANLPLILAGQIYPFRYHQDYFDREIRPHLNTSSGVRFLESPSFEQKLHLLRHARALLLTSTVEETSSLVALEAMACGTPVVGFRRGAFPEIVSEGETGFLVCSVEAIAKALPGVQRLSPEACRARVEQQFASTRMAHEYEDLYRYILARAAESAAA